MGCVKKSLLTCFLSIILSVPALAFHSFVVRHITINGLHRTPRATALNYIPVKVGQELTVAKSNAILRRLYATGFFSDINLKRQGNTLVVDVNELPAIGKFNLVGNEAIPKKALTKIREKSGLLLGRIFDSNQLNTLVQGMKQQYISQGYYNASVTSHVTKLPRNLVSVMINVKQGSVAIVRSIQIIGNHAYSQSHLLDQFSLATPNLFSWFTDSDHYSKQKLDESLQALGDYYRNNGYLQYSLVSQHVSLSLDHTKVYITVHVHEGSKYTVSGAGISGNYPVMQGKKLMSFVTGNAGDVFSRADVMANEQALTNALGNVGYAYPQIQVLPKVNDIKHTVYINYHINTGRIYYVRRINIVGNNRTQDLVLRKMLRQMEGGMYDKKSVTESTRRLRNRPYLRNISVQPSAVPGQNNLLDLNYHVKDVSAGQAAVTLGYQDLQGFIYGAHITQANFLGTGKSVGIGFQNSEYIHSYNLNYNNPYYTIYGVSRGFTLTYTKTTPAAVNLSSYTQDQFGLTVNYGVPVSEYNTINFGYGVNFMHISTSSTETPLSIQDFVKKHGKNYDEIPLNAGWSYSRLDQYPLPTSGFEQDLNFEVDMPANKNSLSYYKASYDSSLYLPLSHNHHFILNLHDNFGYGAGLGKLTTLPFYENYYSGGIATVPGFTANTMGPLVGPTYRGRKEPTDAVGSALGGNILAVAGANLIFPNPVSDRLRTSLGIYAGNVFQNKFGIQGVRYSAGVLITWYSPIGVLDFSFAKPIHRKSGDQTSLFQFTFGSTF